MKKEHKKSSCSSSSTSSDEEKHFDLSMTFDTLNVNQDFQNLPFVVQLQIVIRGEVVYIHLPALNFTLPSTGGFLMTVDGFIPEKIRVRDPAYQSFTLESDQTGTGYDGYIGNDGSIRVVGKGDSPITPGGPQITHAKTITYMLPFKHAKIPKNFALSFGSSQMNQLDNPDIADQFLEFYKNAIVSSLDGKEQILAWCWADNAETKNTAPYNLNVMTRTGKSVTSKKGKKKLKLNDPVLAFTAPLGVYCAENSIVINPTNPNNMFFTTFLIDRRVSPRALQCLVGVSFDAGQNWATRRLDVPPLPHDRSDQNALFDKFGNLWVTYLTSTPNDALPFNMAIMLSTDGGLNFTTVFQTTDATVLLSYDYPQLAFGGDGQGAYALWFSVDLENQNTGTNKFPALGYIPISTAGIPNPSATRLVQLPQFVAGGPNPCTNASLTANAQGEVFVYGFSTSNVTPQVNHTYNKTNMFVNPKGITFQATDILGTYLVAKNNVARLNIVQFQNVRLIVAVPSQGIVYDDTRGLLYALVVDKQPAQTQNMTIYLVYSENGGQSWSSQIQISDSITNDRAIASMAINPVTGDLSFCWYDARDDNTNNTVKFFGAVLPASEIDKIRGIKN